MKTAFVIAAPMSGSGKTTIARELMSIYVRKGRSVQPFKCGPDYIDTKFHEAVCGRPSVNLDTFMATPAHVRELYERYGEGADVCIVEGMMGLFDGYSRDRGSTAEIARVLGLPVVLVVDARSAAYSMAALIRGFITFRSDIRFAGIIFNKVGSARHEQMLRQVCLDLGVHCLACVPKRQDLEVQSRYLGLDFTLTRQPAGGGMSSSGCHPEHKPGELSARGSLLPPVAGAGGAFIALNAESFSFVYQETVDVLSSRYGSVSFFNPETEVPRLDGCELLYLPGGYPEKHLEPLVANEACREAIREYAERGGRIVAECGGMMYLCRTIVTDDGECSMCGVLPYAVSAAKAHRRLSLGYRSFTLDGHEFRGHEFHYSQFVKRQEPGSSYLPCLPPSACQVCDAKGTPVATPVLRYRQVLASYTHLYLPDCLPFLFAGKGE